MDRKKFMEELEYLLQDISVEERKEALEYYQDYFEEAGEGNEQKVLIELGSPSRVAAIIKAGLKGTFDEHIEVGNQGFSNQDYQENYEIVDSHKTSHTQGTLKDRWHNMESRDKLIMIVILLLALIPLSFPIFGIFKGVFGFGFGMATLFACLFFGFLIMTIVLHGLAILLIVVGVLQLFSVPGAGLIYIGMGCILMGLGKIFAKLSSWFFKDCIPSLIDAVSALFNKIFGNRGVTHENNI